MLRFTISNLPINELVICLILQVKEKKQEEALVKFVCLPHKYS